jgi:hypothetical protein
MSEGVVILLGLLAFVGAIICIIAVKEKVKK